LDINYRLISTYSNDRLVNHGTTDGFYFDSSLQNYVTGGGGATGVGEINNEIYNATVQSSFMPNTYATYASQGVNQGRIQRVQEACYDTSLVANNGLGPSALTYATTNLQNYCNRDVNNAVIFYYVANIRLSMLHQVFKKLGIIRNCYMTLKFYMNTECTCYLSGGGTNGSTFTAYSTTANHGILPLTVSPIGVNMGLSGLGASGANVAQLQLNIGKSNIGGTPYVHPMQQCRFYASQYKFTQKEQDSFLNRMPIKKVVYEDIYYYPILNIAPNTQFNNIISSAISRIRSLLIVPVVSASAHYSGTVGGTGTVASPMLSPFSSCPATTAMRCSITNFNVLLSGTPQFPANYLYSWEQYLYQCAKTGINEGRGDEISSGLISYNDFINNKGFVYVDLSDCAGSADDEVQRVVQLTGYNINNSGASGAPIAIDYHCFIRYERQFDISTSTGQLVFR